MATDEASGAGERVRVLKHLAEPAGRLHRRKHFERAVGSQVSVLEEPFIILTRQPGASADQMLDQDAARDVCVAELERWQEACDGRLPGQLAFVQELRKHQRRQRLRIRRDDIKRVGVRCGRSAEFTDAEAAREDDLAILNDANRRSRHAELLKPGLYEARELGDPLCVKLVGGLAGECLAFVTLRQQPAEDQCDLPSSLLADRLVHVVNNDGPYIAPATRVRRDITLFVRGGLIRVVTNVRPAIVVGEVVLDFKKPFRIGAIRGPGRRDRGVGVLCLYVDQRDMRVALRRREDGRRAAHLDLPTGWRDELVALDRRPGRVGSENLTCGLQERGRTRLQRQGA